MSRKHTTTDGASCYCKNLSNQLSKRKNVIKLGTPLYIYIYIYYVKLGTSGHFYKGRSPKKLFLAPLVKWSFKLALQI